MGAALAALDGLPVKGRAPKTGYSRALFPHWRDTDGDGCDADDQAVIRSANVELAGPCRVVAGALVDPYTGKTVRWSGSRAGVVDVDHVVSLSNAWQTGAQALTLGERRLLANDQLNVVPVAAGVNRSKGDGDAATWLPSLRSYRCAYVARQIAVKAKYRLWVTAAEKAAMEGVLVSCPGEGVPSGPATTEPSPSREPVPAPSTSRPSPGPSAPERETQDAPAGGLRTCADVKRAGIGPYKRGRDVEYARYRDADGDGVVCES